MHGLPQKRPIDAACIPDAVKAVNRMNELISIIKPRLIEIVGDGKLIKNGEDFDKSTRDALKAMTKQFPSDNGLHWRVSCDPNAWLHVSVNFQAHKDHWTSANGDCFLYCFGDGQRGSEDKYKAVTIKQVVDGLNFYKKQYEFAEKAVDDALKAQQAMNHYFMR